MAETEEHLKSELILDELKKRQRTKDIVDVEEERVKVVIFICGVNRYAFYGRDIREILPLSVISWVPGLPEYLPGLINVRGDIESVIDIGYFLGERRRADGSGLVAMAVHGEFRSGVIIDSIEDVIDIPLSAIRPPLSTLDGAAREFVIGEIEHASGMAVLLDIGKLETKISL